MPVSRACVLWPDPPQLADPEPWKRTIRHSLDGRAWTHAQMVREFLGSPQLLVGNFCFRAFHVNACTLSTLCAPSVAKSKLVGHDQCVNPAPDWVERGLPLVRPIAESLKRRLPVAIQLDDLMGAGRLALVERAHKYDPENGLPFEAWARFVIRGAMIDSIKGAPFREAKHAELKTAPAAASPSPEEAAACSSDRQIARRALAVLSDRQRLVLVLLYVDGLSLQAVAQELNLSRPDALRVRRQAIERLRRFGRRLSCAALEGELTDVRSRARGGDPGPGQWHGNWGVLEKQCVTKEQL